MYLVYQKVFEEIKGLNILMKTWRKKKIFHMQFFQ